MWSFGGGGIKNTASGIGAFIGGGGINSGATTVTGNIASGALSSVLGGNNNQATQAYASILGGYQNLANGPYSVVIGGSNGSTRSINGYVAIPASVFTIFGSSPVGSNQAGILVLGKQTTDATATALTSDGNAAGTTNQVILPNNSAYYFKGSVIANVTGAANGAAWSFEGAIMRGANAASTVFIGTPALNRVAASAGATAWTIAITADTTNGGLAITVTGVAGTTIRWVAKLETTEVTY